MKWLEIQSGYLLTEYGVLPRTLSGLKGVITSPFIHGDMKHLISNSLPLLVLLSGLFYFYKAMAYRVFAGIFLLGGIWLWIGGRESYHIGASGLVYGLTTFLFLSGVVRREARLMALSLLVVFLYGGMVWECSRYLKESHGKHIYLVLLQEFYSLLFIVKKGRNEKYMNGKRRK
ncbi:MAG: rhomboid family intramembrane serine protease [Bacteroidetes bacterium]|nr:rhomboid family intramembrane serine protease [Bacteroidota bacterium]